MTQQVTALCNECGKITDVVYQEQKHPNDIQELYFKCEHCYYHYTCFVTDTWVRKKYEVVAHLRETKQISKFNFLHYYFNSSIMLVKICGSW